MKQLLPFTKKLVEDCFSKQKPLLMLGAKLTKVEYGSVQIFLPKTQLSIQQHGFIHGGVLSLLADCCAGLSGYTDLKNPEDSCITIEMKINFLKPANTDVRGVGKIMKATKFMMVTTAEIFTEDDQLCAYMLQSLKRNTKETSNLKVI